MLILTNGSNAFDFSRFIASWSCEVEPAFTYTELLNGNIVKQYDLGNTSDKFFCNLVLNIDNAAYQTFNIFYKSVKGKGDLSISTDLDLFFPNVYNPVSCQIVEIKNSGYVSGDIMSALQVLDIRLFLTGTPIYSVTSSIPTCFSKGLWTNEYTYSDSYQRSQVGTKSFVNTFEDDSNIWTVSFNYLRRAEANSLMSWLLTQRTDSVNITTNNLNSNLANVWKPGDAVTTLTAPYNVRSFSFENHATYYTGEIEFVGSWNR